MSRRIHLITLQDQTLIIIIKSVSRLKTDSESFSPHRANLILVWDVTTRSEEAWRENEKVCHCPTHNALPEWSRQQLCILLQCLSVRRMTVVPQISLTRASSEPTSPQSPCRCLRAVYCRSVSARQVCYFTRSRSGSLLRLLLCNVWSVNYKIFPKSWIIAWKRVCPGGNKVLAFSCEKCSVWTFQAEQLDSWALIGRWWHTSQSPFDLCGIWEHERPVTLLTWTLPEPAGSTGTCGWYITNLQKGSIFNLIGGLGSAPLETCSDADKDW